MPKSCGTGRSCNQDSRSSRVRAVQKQMYIMGGLCTFFPTALRQDGLNVIGHGHAIRGKCRKDSHDTICDFVTVDDDRGEWNEEDLCFCFEVAARRDVQSLEAALWNTPM